MARSFVLLTENEMRDDTGEDVDTEERQGHDEHVEVAVVSFPNTVPHPRTVVVKPV